MSYIETRQDLSVYYWLVGLFSDAPFVKVVDGFPEDEFTIPTIALELEDIDTYRLELGSREFGKIRRWYIDIFAMSKSQRDEFAFRILHALDEKIPVYDYDLGFPPTVVPKIGVIDPQEVSVKIIKVLPELTESMYYRSVVYLTALYEEI